MSATSTTPVLLRRIAQLEATVGRLSQDLGDLRLVLSRQAARAPAANAKRSATGGLAAAKARGEAARVQWVRAGLVVTGEQLAQAWGLTRQALAPAADRGEIFSVKVGNRLYYPQAFLGLERQAVAAVCHALGGLGATEKLMFWLREHGSLGDTSVAAALEAGVALAKVERLAAAWARERGAAPQGARVGRAP